MERLTWKHIALAFLALLFIALVAGLYTFGGPDGQTAAGTIGSLGLMAVCYAFLFLSGGDR